MNKPVIIFGAGSLGKQAYDIFVENEVIVYGFLDDNKDLLGKEIGDATVLGSTDDRGFLKLIGQKCEAFIAIGEQTVREKIAEMLRDNRKMVAVNALHRSAIFSKMAAIGHGNFIGAGAVLSPQSELGNYNIVETRAVIGASCQLSDFTNVGIGAILNPGVELGAHVFVGSGAVLVSGISSGQYSRIGAGSVVVKNLTQKETVFGNPAQKIG